MPRLPESRLDLATRSEAEAERRRKEEEARFGLGWESVGMAAQMVAVSSPAGCDDVNTQVPEMFLKEVITASNLKNMNWEEDLCSCSVGIKNRS